MTNKICKAKLRDKVTDCKNVAVINGYCTMHFKMAQGIRTKSTKEESERRIQFAIGNHKKLYS